MMVRTSQWYEKEPRFSYCEEEASRWCVICGQRVGTAWLREKRS